MRASKTTGLKRRYASKRRGEPHFLNAVACSVTHFILVFSNSIRQADLSSQGGRRLRIGLAKPFPRQTTKPSSNALRRHGNARPIAYSENFGKNLVGVERFELPTLWSQTRCATRLRYTPCQGAGEIHGSDRCRNSKNRLCRSWVSLFSRRCRSVRRSPCRPP
jgi:hypothetical protein